MTNSIAAAVDDQAFTLPFKLTLAAQAAAGLVFGFALAVHSSSRLG